MIIILAKFIFGGLVMIRQFAKFSFPLKFVVIRYTFGYSCCVGVCLCKLYMHTHTHTRARTHTCADMHMYTHTHTHADRHARHKHTYIHAHARRDVRVPIGKHTHMYTHTRTHTHVSSYVLLHKCLSCVNRYISLATKTCSPLCYISMYIISLVYIE